MTASSAAPTASPVELVYDDFEPEIAATRRMLERFPEGRPDWRPHAKSRTLAELATHVADIPNRGTMVLQTEENDLSGRQPMVPLATSAALLAHFDQSVAKLRAALAAADFDSLARSWTMRRGPQVIVQAPRRRLLRSMMMSHLIHHRAQLSVYYRLLDVPVPGMYGPSADDAPPR
jgi:uncharacterized damage-inducible protein DinB